MQTLRLRSLPPLKGWIGRWPRVVPLVGLFREFEIVGMAVAEQHIHAVFPFVIMPLAPGIVFVSIGPPNPVALNELVGRAASDFAGLDRSSFWRSWPSGVTSHMLYAEGLDRPDREVAIAPTIVATADAFRKH